MLTPDNTSFYCLSNEFLDQVMNGITESEMIAFGKLVDMLCDFRNGLEESEPNEDVSNVVLVEQMAKMASILVFGSTTLRQMFNRIYSMLPEPRSLTGKELKKIKERIDSRETI